MTQQIPDFGDIKVVRTGASTRATAPAAVAVTPAPDYHAIVPTEPMAPKKSGLARFWWLPVLAALGIAAVMWGHNYYNQRYVGSDYWAQVPANQDTTLVESISDSGQATGVYGVTYVLTAFNEAGESRQVDFVFHADNEAAVPQPGEFLWISAKPTIVVRQHVVPQSEVPANVQALIAAHGN